MDTHAPQLHTNQNQVATHMLQHHKLTQQNSSSIKNTNPLSPLPKNVPPFPLNKITLHLQNFLPYNNNPTTSGHQHSTTIHQYKPSGHPLPTPFQPRILQNSKKLTDVPDN